MLSQLQSILNSILALLCNDGDAFYLIEIAQVYALFDDLYSAESDPNYMLEFAVELACLFSD